MFMPGMNTGNMLRNYFQTEEKPMSTEEFIKFWLYCTEAERLYYRTIDLSEYK